VSAGHTLRIDVRAGHTLGIGVRTGHTLGIGVRAGHTLEIGLETRVLQIDMNLEHILRIDLSHIYCRSMLLPIIHSVPA
jgi:hypothetical protein